MTLGILLAAGLSRRFGADKLALALPDGVPVALQAARHLGTALPRILAVVHPGAQHLARLLMAEGIPVGICPDAAQGMGASLAWAVRQAADADAWVVALADMPWIQPRTIGLVAAALDRPDALVVPCHQGRRGHPVGFGRAYRQPLLDLGGDAGARSILAGHAAQVRELDCPDPGILADIDRPADLQWRPGPAGS